MVKNMHVKRLALTMLLMIIGVNISSSISAQTAQTGNDEVTLVVSGEGATKDEATKVALRSAIEQAFGTFVSANTQILNDELVKDEIVTVSSGNVKNYEYLSEIKQSGKYYVTLNATVSIRKLISYAKSKGSKAEFAGQTFAMNIKLMELRAQNTLAAYKNMCLQVRELAKYAFDFKIELGEPYLVTKKTSPVVYSYEQPTYNPDVNGYIDGYRLNVRIKVLANPATSQIHSLVTNTLNALVLSSSEYNKIKNYYSGYVNLGNLYGSKSNVILPINDKDKEEFQKYRYYLSRIITSAFLNYNIVDTSNPQYYLAWQQGLKRTNKVVGLRRDNAGYMWPMKRHDNGNRKLWLVDTNGESAEAIQYGSVEGSIEFYMNYWNPYDFNSVNWSRWALPVSSQPISSQIDKSKKTSKKKKNNDNEQEKPVTEYVDVEQVILTYSITFFIPKDKMSSFTGLAIERRSTPFNMVPRDIIY